MTRRPLQTTVLLVLLAVAVAPAQPSFASTEAFLPSVGSAPGVPPSVWYTTVWVFNPNETVASVDFTFLRRDQSNIALDAAATADVGPGAILQVDNAVETLFGIQGFGAIRVVSDQNVEVIARIYSRAGDQQDRDSVGQLFAAVAAEKAIGVGDEANLIGLTNLEGGDFRYNVGFVETTGNEIQLEVSLKATSGSSWVTSSITLLPYEQKQLSVNALFNHAIGDSDNFRLHVVGFSRSGRAIVFGSRVANGSQDAMTFEMISPPPP